MDVSVIIVNYNTCNLLDECIKSIYQHTKDVDYEIIVVDNASSDSSISMVKTKYPHVKLLESDINIGFGRANNLGFEQSQGRNIFLLNSDTILIENSIKTLSDILEKDPSTGAVGCKLIDRSGRDIHSFGKFPSIYKKILGREFMVDNVTFNEPKEVDYITGADLMIPRSVWIKVGGFDPNFFLYYEETDLQKRMASLGYKRLIIPQTKIIHLEGESSKSKGNASSSQEWKKITMFTSMNYYMKKHSAALQYLVFKNSLKLKYYYLLIKSPEKANYYYSLINCMK